MTFRSVLTLITYMYPKYCSRKLDGSAIQLSHGILVAACFHTTANYIFTIFSVVIPPAFMPTGI